MHNLIIENHKIETIDLHMHTTVSDGTDTPPEIVDRVKEAGIDLFAVTDHDAIQGAVEVSNMPAVKNGDILFLKGVEFSCKDEDGKYHILGYQYDETSSSILDVVNKAHELRMSKVVQRIDFLKEEFGLPSRMKTLISSYITAIPASLI